MIGLVESGGGVPRYQLKIILERSNPPIWRRVVVPGTIRLDRLHKVIQLAMGWENCHLHKFTAGRDSYGIPDPDFDSDVLDERRYTLQNLVTKIGQRFGYQYDFGDNWEHEVQFEQMLSADPAFKHPACLDGENACPPEDCGGIHNYYDLLEAIKNPQHEQHVQLKEWIGGAWDPAAFDLKAANRLLKRVKV